jgi:hypothetical protein
MSNGRDRSQGAAFRRSAVGRGGFLVALLFAISGAALAEDTVAGAWVGHYLCGQGTTGLTLTVATTRGSPMRALFHFYADQSDHSVPEGCYEMEGTYDVLARHVELVAGKWILQPDGYVTVDLSGDVSSDGSVMKGAVIGPGCGAFELHHVAASSPRAQGACRPGAAFVTLP